MTPLRLAGAGAGVVGVTYGMARYGYGLLLPAIRDDYRLGPGSLGAIGTGSYGTYLLATTLTGALAARVGPRRTATAAATIAAVGMLVAGLARSAGLFAAGLLFAGAGAGLAFAPFSDAARDLPAVARGRVLSVINCSTGFGVALAAPIAARPGWSSRRSPPAPPAGRGACSRAAPPPRTPGSTDARSPGPASSGWSRRGRWSGWAARRTGPSASST
jgi:MFS family permease